MYLHFQIGSFKLAFGKLPGEPMPPTLEGERKLISAAKYLIADRGFQTSPFGDLSLDETPQDDNLFASLRLISELTNGHTNFVSVDECAELLLDMASDEVSALAAAAGGR